MAEVKLITHKIKQKYSSASFLSGISRNIILALLNQLEVGRLIIHEDSRRIVLGKHSEFEAHIQVNNARFYTKLLQSGSTGAGEAYIEGWWDSDNVTKVVELIAANLPTLDRLEKRLEWLTAPFNFLSRLSRRNTQSRAKDNIMAHYDLGNVLYENFLDSTMLYSAAIYPDKTATLEQASYHKLAMVCERLQIRETDHLLEIGTGWGALAIYAAQHYGCQVTTTTISEQQYVYVKQKIEFFGLTDHIKLLKSDYRELNGTYDKLVSIEMIEAVGHQYIPCFFEQCGRLLKPGGRMVIQSILIDDNRYNAYRNSVDFIQKYIFPGGALPCKKILSQAVDKSERLSIIDFFSFGKDYAKTISDWRYNFNRNWEALKAHGFDERFKRLWNFYFHYCEGGFRQNTIDVAHIVLTKNRELR